MTHHDTGHWNGRQCVFDTIAVHHPNGQADKILVGVSALYQGSDGIEGGRVGATIRKSLTLPGPG